MMLEICGKRAVGRGCSVSTDGVGGYTAGGGRGVVLGQPVAAGFAGRWVTYEMEDGGLRRENAFCYGGYYC
jgi:hypothetical protein